MTIKQLIEHLKEYKPTLNVAIETEENSYEDFTLEEAFGSIIIKTF